MNFAYSGIDFVVIDHTNLVFEYGTNPAFDFTIVDNCVTRAATALKNGFNAYASGGERCPPAPFASR